MATLRLHRNIASRRNEALSAISNCAGKLHNIVFNIIVFTQSAETVIVYSRTEEKVCMDEDNALAITELLLNFKGMEKCYE